MKFLNLSLRTKVVGKLGRDFWAKIVGIVDRQRNSGVNFVMGFSGEVL